MPDVIHYDLHYPKRLLALASHIEKLPPELFDMSLYREQDEHTLAHCGTVGCILGHAPRLLIRRFGVKMVDLVDCVDGPVRDRRIDWVAVSHFLGVERHTDLWNYLFDGDWNEVDNTNTGAAARIRWVVEHQGIPMTWQRELWGKAPLSYTVPEQAQAGSCCGQGPYKD